MIGTLARNEQPRLPMKLMGPLQQAGVVLVSLGATEVPRIRAVIAARITACLGIIQRRRKTVELCLRKERLTSIGGDEPARLAHLT